MFDKSPTLLAIAVTLFGILASTPDFASGQTPEIDQLRVAAEEGDAASLNDLGSALMIHSIGDGLQVEEAATHPGLIEARSLIQRAHELGNAEATHNYATILRMGYGGPPDLELSDRLIVEAAAAGSVGANMTLATWALEGLNGLDPDPEQALAYMRAAAEAGNNFAQWRLAMMILQGIGTEPNSEEAYRWLVTASEQGGVNAMVSRGVMLATGDGVAEDDFAAREWYRRAAESGEIGFDQALKNLGGMYFTGEGGPEDRLTGFAYFLISAASGNEEAVALRDRFAGQLTEAEIERAFEIAQQWIDTFFPSDEAILVEGVEP